MPRCATPFPGLRLVGNASLPFSDRSSSPGLRRPAPWPRIPGAAPAKPPARAAFANRLPASREAPMARPITAGTSAFHLRPRSSRALGTAPAQPGHLRLSAFATKISEGNNLELLKNFAAVADQRIRKIRQNRGNARLGVSSYPASHSPVRGTYRSA